MSATEAEMGDVMGTRCRLFHAWGRWHRVQLTWYFTSGRALDADGQQRACERCGKTQRKRL